MRNLSDILPVAPETLRAAGVIGINERNVDYIFRMNPREHYPRVDDKILTKQICQDNGIAVPETYGVINANQDLRTFEGITEKHDDFVVKPARGAAGRGVMVVTWNDGETFHVGGRGETVNRADLDYHLSMILGGLYSLGGRVDRALVEERIKIHPAFGHICVGGTPDIRIVVYREFPIMAMIRLPTQASGGRANLHQGAVGVGVGLSSGRTIAGVYRNRYITEHPDTGVPFVGLQIGNWEEIVGIAVRLSHVLGLGYVGVDLVVDAERGPVVLEANARPGLIIQLANKCGLRPLLEAIDERVAAGNPS